MKIFTLTFIFFIVLNGCSSKEIFVYEKIPENMECNRFKEYFAIESCDRKKRVTFSKKIFKVIEKINSP